MANESVFDIWNSPGIRGKARDDESLTKQVLFSLHIYRRDQKKSLKQCTTPSDCIRDRQIKERYRRAELRVGKKF